MGVVRRGVFSKSEDIRAKKAIFLGFLQRTAKGASGGATSKNVKNRQKVSKIFSTLFDIFRAGQKKSKIVKKCQKYSRHFSTIFSAAPVFGPFWGALIPGFPVAVRPSRKGQKWQKGQKTAGKGQFQAMVVNAKI